MPYPPQGGGIRKLSELAIDIDKNWLGYRIKNLGSPVDAGDAVRKTDLDSHRTASPIDHPDGSVTRSHLEYPTVGVSFSYLSVINKVLGLTRSAYSFWVATRDTFTDKAVFQMGQVNQYSIVGGRIVDRSNHYEQCIDIAASTADHFLRKLLGGTFTIIASEVVDLDRSGEGMCLSISGSTLKGSRWLQNTPLDPLSLPTPTATISATDTSFASGLYGFFPLRETTYHGGTDGTIVYLLAPASALPQAQSILELDIEGTGKPDDPYRPSISKNLVEISMLTGLPDFLYQEARKYDVLKAKGFTDDEIRVLLGYIPQHQVDLDSVTWGAFELHADKAPTAIVVITGDDQYQAGAIERQKAVAKRVFAPPTTYDDAVTLYNQLKKDYPHWLAGKDNFAYQTLGHEIFDWMQNVDFYYGELIEHKTHYDQLKRVPDFEIRNRLNELINRLSKVSVLIDERGKHISKAKEILRRGW
jgi:hypothetical protein